MIWLAGCAPHRIDPCDWNTKHGTTAFDDPPPPELQINPGGGPAPTNQTDLAEPPAAPPLPDAPQVFLSGDKAETIQRSRLAAQVIIHRSKCTNCPLDNPKFSVAWLNGKLVDHQIAEILQVRLEGATNRMNQPMQWFELTNFNSGLTNPAWITISNRGPWLWVRAVENEP